MKGSALEFRPLAAISGLLLMPLLLFCAACDLIDGTPPPNIPATVAAEVEETAATVVEEVEETAATVVEEVEESAATVVEEVEETAATVVEEVEETAATVSALLTPEPPPTPSPPPPTVQPTPTSEPTPPPTETSPTEPVATATPTPTPATPTPISSPSPEPVMPTPLRTTPTPESADGTEPTLAPTAPQITLPLPTLAPVIPFGSRAETITTSLGREVDATVAGFVDSSLRFDQLIQAINEAERLLGAPFPSPRVNMQKVREVAGGFCGNNQMSYALRYLGDPYVVDGSVISLRIDDECDETFLTIAHEVAHTWFHGNDPADWIDEGLANAIEAQVVRAKLQDRVFYPPVTYCQSLGNLSELERGAPSRISQDPYSGYGCYYSLGDGIFGELREFHGDSGFNQRIARLARRSENETDRAHTIDDVRSVLGDNPQALEIINRWYEGQPEMRKYRHLDAVDWTFPPTIDGEYLLFAGRITPPDAVHDFVIGDDLQCSQFSLGEGISNLEWVQSVSRPLPAGRTHHQDSRVITINHHINPDTGEFRFTAIILNNALAGDQELSLSIKERVATGSDGRCLESINYAQIPVAFGSIPQELKQAAYFHLDAVDWTSPPTIDGEYLHFAGRTTEPGLVHNLVLGNDPFCSQFALFRNIINQERVATFSDPLSVGWSHGEVPKVVVVNDQINPGTGEFSVTARINDPGLSQIAELSLLIKSRATVGANNLCGASDNYSQIAVSLGEIPNELKVTRHYHLDAIHWTNPPAISGASLTFAGIAEPGSIGLESKDGYCGQFSLYWRDESGYHRIASLAPLLPNNMHWTNPQAAEMVEGWTYTDGKFNATARLSPDLLSQYRNLILVVSTAAAVDPITNLCGESDVLSAIDIQ